MGKYKSIIKMDSDVLEEYEVRHLSPKTRKTLNILSTVLTIATAGISFMLRTYGLIIMVLPIIILDFLLLGIRMIAGKRLIIHDWKLNNDINYLTKFVDKLSKHKNIRKGKEFQQTHCKECYNAEVRRDGTIYCYNRNRMCDKYGRYYYHQELLDTYSRSLTKMQKEQAIALAKENTKKSAEFDDKIKFFEMMSIRTKVFADEITSSKNKTGLSNIKEILLDIVDKINKLSKLLAEKPERMQVVPRTLYVYLDELQLILNHFTDLPKEKKNDYSVEIEKVCKALSENIQHTINRVENFNTEKLEVSLETLLQELTKENTEERGEE